MAQDTPKKGRNNVTTEAARIFDSMLRERERIGIRTYGTTLQTWNGRDAVVDTLEELIDAFQYTIQLFMERDDIESSYSHLQQALQESDGDPQGECKLLQDLRSCETLRQFVELFSGKIED